MSYGGIRILVLFGLAIYAFVIKNKIKKRRQEHIDQSLENYEKDENGLYPWEANTDDSPENIPQNAKVFKEKDKVRRGGW
ncbi:hypothetical protein IV487_12960 [Enterococcus saccharolyticus]|uniref:tetraspanin family protein n=1 Tax=Enterococcus TaxID=1350 RepID=UPI00137B3B2B|nr:MULTISPECIES: tetraspanin family protein [Enterococcus]MCD5003372.1 hypothetical protein [Enterococcus saccharolyticus]